jgi:hypothetical protein
MRLGKKKDRDRDPDNKFQIIENIHRLVCSYKNSSLKGIRIIITEIIYDNTNRIFLFPFSTFHKMQLMLMV